MNLASAIKYKQIIADGDWAGLMLAPIDTQHPPSLKNNKKITAPTPADGWHNSDSPASKKMARVDLAEIMQRVRRQAGKPTLSETTPVAIFPQGVNY